MKIAALLFCTNHTQTIIADQAEILWRQRLRYEEVISVQGSVFKMLLAMRMNRPQFIRSSVKYTLNNPT